MNRSVEKYCAEYEKIHEYETGKASFYVSDYNGIRNLWKKEGCGIVNLIDIALRFGFMVGYKCAKREAYKKN